MTREEAVKLHREMWRWIAAKSLEENRIVGREEFFKTHNVYPFMGEFCCDYLDKIGEASCEKCPLDWKDKKNGFDYCLLSQIIGNISKTSVERYIELAVIIAYLPERGETINE